MPETRLRAIQQASAPGESASVALPLVGASFTSILQILPLFIPVGIVAGAQGRTGPDRAAENQHILRLVRWAAVPVQLLTRSRSTSTRACRWPGPDKRGAVRWRQESPLRAACACGSLRRGGQVARPVKRPPADHPVQ